MIKKNVKIIGVSLLLIIMNSCSKKTVEGSILPLPSEGNSELGIEGKVPSSLASVYVTNFNRYTSVVTPNGGRIHIVAQSNITNEKIVRCRSILEHYLRNYPSSQYGADKSAVANQMARNNAVLCLMNGSDNGNNPVANKIQGQPLYDNEIQVEGGAWYMNQNYSQHRDASFEEILHLVHDNGIGVDGNNGKEGALPAYQTEIRAAQETALTQRLWAIDSPNMVNEWRQENSLTQEYLASVIDSYYGLWGAWSGSETNGMWGLYVAKTRAEIATEDVKGNELMNRKFFHPYLTYNARIDVSLNGVFSLKLDSSKPYTHCSQYLKDITLLGSNNNSVVVNQLDNDITGNEGVNTILFSGSYSEYTVVTNNLVTTVTDNTSNRDGVNTLKKVEKLQFTDQTITL